MTARSAGTSHEITVDLHLHSTASDGSNPPDEVVALAVRAGVSAIALTDHDTVDGIATATSAAGPAGVRIVPGVELSAFLGDQEIHLLGLHLERLEEMQRQLAVFRAARRARAETIVRRLNAIGVRITFDDVLSGAGDAALGRPHVARALVQNGWARDHRDAFDRYLGAGRPAFVEKRRLLMRDAIALVHRCGGIAVLAHPGGEGTRARVEGLVALGLDGIEVLHPSHSADDRARLLELTSYFGIVPSGGSDAHGAADPTRRIGIMRVPMAWLEQQDDRAARRRAEARVA